MSCLPRCAVCDITLRGNEKVVAVGESGGFWCSGEDCPIMAAARAGSVTVDNVTDPVSPEQLLALYEDWWLRSGSYTRAGIPGKRPTEAVRGPRAPKGPEPAALWKQTGGGQAFINAMREAGYIS